MKRILYIFLFLVGNIVFAQSDCVTAIPICGNSNISYTPTGPGTVLDIPYPAPTTLCLKRGESFSVWYTFTIATAGTLTFDITPNAGSTDYDFAVWGPGFTCGNLGTPIRCNFDGTNPTTGLTTTNPPPYAYEAALDVLPGETYVLLVDNYSLNTTGFSMTWGGTATLSSAFTDPTLAPHPFVPPGQPSATPNSPNEVMKCALPGSFDFTTLTAGITNSNANFLVTYHDTQNDAITGANPLTTATVNAATTYYYRIRYEDPTNPNNPINSCFQTGTFKFRKGDIVPSNKTLFACNNNNTNLGIYDLSAAAVYIDPTNTVTKKYYKNMADAQAQINEITTPNNYVVAAPSTAIVRITTGEGCVAFATLTLEYYPVVVVKDEYLETCAIETNTSTGQFNLSQAIVSTQLGIVKGYYRTMADALSQTNEIMTPLAYITPSTVVFCRVNSADGCFNIAKVTLHVIPPVYSSTLKDKYICVENLTTLDAGPGFYSYQWSNGATTQSITNVGVGTYTVRLQTGTCFINQTVNVKPLELPVIKSVDVSFEKISVKNVVGGNPPYQYSIDGVNYQDSPEFSPIPRGETTVYVKDSSNCTAVTTTVTVPNIANAITPNGDNINDYIDYSALANKKNLAFTVYDRYGNQVFKGEKFNNYKWDGRMQDKKIQTGTYWYTLTWNENDTNNTPIIYNGWVLVKNKN